MSDDAEKPFEATPQRIEKAKREGDVARSAELPANLSFACAACAVVAIVQPLGGQARGAIVAAASGRVEWAACAAIFALALVPVGAAAAAAVAAGALQGGLRVGAFGAKLVRLNPIEGIKRIVSRETFAHGARAAAAFALAAGAILPIAGAAISQMLHANAPPVVAAAAWRAVERVSLAACATGSLFALAE
ncbi:MAG TPA: EscU/YscU/HrcU family type III secretion system export apparatus switch protein [Candidatus Tumulicola sp.]